MSFGSLKCRVKKHVTTYWGNEGSKVHSDKKISDRSRFLESNFDGFLHFSQKVVDAQKSHIPHWKALIFSFQNLYRPRAWLSQKVRHAPLNETRTFFTKRGVEALLEGPHPLSIEILKAEYQGFPMRYTTFL